jgi:4'-phosphopantetheinyl transferase
MLPQLSLTEVHVWKANLDLPIAQIRSLAVQLSEDERARADRFYNQTDRDSFITARGLLRTVLGQYLNTPPDRLQFQYQDRGKPFLQDSPIEFNVTHSHGLALYAIAQSRRVGIDLEYVRDIEVQALAQRFFSDREFQQLQALPLDRQTATFFQYWTAKEAYLKATGEGLAGLSQIEIIELLKGDAISLDLAYKDASQWRLQPLDRILGTVDYAAAVVAEGKDWTLHCADFILNSLDRSLNPKPD